LQHPPTRLVKMHTPLGLLIGLAMAAAAVAGAPAAASASLPRLLSEVAAPPPSPTWDGFYYEGYPQEFGSGSGPGLQARYSVPADTSDVTDFSYMFGSKKIQEHDFNEPLTGLNTTSGTTFLGMFQVARSFNQPFDHFVTKNGITFDFMFALAKAFNQPLSGWDTSSATTMQSMLNGAGRFNQPLEHFVTTNVVSFQQMFMNAGKFDQPLNGWDTSSATEMGAMFVNAIAFNQPIGGWDVSSVTGMNSMFTGTSAFSQEIDVWDVGSVAEFGGMFQSSLMRADAIAGAQAARAGTIRPGFGRACRLHHSWSEQNAAWSPVWASLVDDAADLDMPLCAPYLPGGALQGDPHLGLAHGGHTDFRGCDGCLFNFLSTRDVTVNARLRAATFTLNGSTVHGTFVTEVHVATLERATRSWLNALYWAKEVGEGNWGWKVVNGSCGGRSFSLYPLDARACGAGGATTAHSSAVFALPEWEVGVKSHPVYDRIEGPMHRLDLSLRPLLPEARLAKWPHGLIGQSFNGDARPRQGKQDDYSTPVVWTTAQAEGAIEGVADDYRVAAPFATEFCFSRFDPIPGGKRDPAPVAAPKSAWAPPPDVVPGVATPAAGVTTAGDDA